MTEQEFDELWEYLVHRYYSDESNRLSHHESIFYSLNILRGSVPRSGFIGYFENSTGANILLTIKALKELGLSEVLKILDEAISIAIKGKALQNSDSPIKLFPDLLSEEEYESEIEKLEQKLTPLENRFYQHDNLLWKVLCEFADNNKLKARS